MFLKLEFDLVFNVSWFIAKVLYSSIASFCLYAGIACILDTKGVNHIAIRRRFCTVAAMSCLHEVEQDAQLLTNSVLSAYF